MGKYASTEFGTVLSKVIPYLGRTNPTRMWEIIDAVKTPQGCHRVMNECYAIYSSIMD